MASGVKLRGLGIRLGLGLGTELAVLGGRLAVLLWAGFSAFFLEFCLAVLSRAGFSAFLDGRLAVLLRAGASGFAFLCGRLAVLSRAGFAAFLDG